MSSTIENIRAKVKRRFSQKDKDVNFDEYDEADEETSESLAKELDTAEKDESNPFGKPGSLLNRLIMHGNKKTEEELAKDLADAEARQRGQAA